MKKPAHTPYDGSATPFTIGLKPFDMANWIEIDGDLEAYLAEKDRLFLTAPDRVFMARPDTIEAQREVLDDLVRHLPGRFPGTFRLAEDRMAIGEEGRSVPLAADDPAPLKTASLLVQDDLVLMRKCDDGWRLVAASLCFPSSWSLAEKFDRPMQVIHATVPDFGPGTRTAGMITRIFDKLRVELPVERLNWSLQENAALYHPRSKKERDEGREVEGGFLAGMSPDRIHLRVERQTLRKMPRSGDILFTIRIFLDPISVLVSHPAGPELACRLLGQLAALDAEQLAYKGLAVGRERLTAYLRQVADSAPVALDGQSRQRV